MEIHYIPVNGHDDKYIIYRPLLKMAFLGNRALCQVIQEAAASGDLESASIPVEISQFLHSIGFDQPDPSPPTRDSTSSRPTSAVILLTNQCNLRCIYCYASAGERTPATVSLDLARPVIDQVVENAAKSGKKHFDLVFHGGGEPMVAWKEMQEIVDYARSKRLPCKVGMVSNGVWNQTQREWVVANLDRCTVSIDGGPQTQDLQRPLAGGKGSFEKVRENLRFMDERKFSYSIRMTAMAPFRERFPGDVRFLFENTACSSIAVEPCFNEARGGHGQALLEEALDFVEGYLNADLVAEEFGRPLNYSGAKPSAIRSSFCGASYGGALIVNPEGDLVSCYEVTDSLHPLFEISHMGRVDGSTVIVDRENRQRLTAILDARFEDCEDCFCRWHCAGDCYVRTNSDGSGMRDPESPRCMINQQITAGLLLRRISKSENGVYLGKRQGSRRVLQPSG